MKNIVIDAIPGSRLVLKQYDEVLLAVLEARKQTHEQAAKDLGISKSTFAKMLRQTWKPNFRTPRGKLLADRICRWSTYDAEFVFPPALFTEEYVKAPKTFILKVPHRLHMIKGDDQKLLASVVAKPAQWELVSPVKALPPAKKRRKKRRSHRSARY